MDLEPLESLTILDARKRSASAASVPPADDFWHETSNALAAALHAKSDAVLLHFLHTAPIEEVALLAGGKFAATAEKTQESIRSVLADRLAAGTKR